MQAAARNKFSSSHLLFLLIIHNTLNITWEGKPSVTTQLDNYLVWGQSGTLLKEQGSRVLDISLRGTSTCHGKAYMYWDRKGSNPLFILICSILFEC